MGLSNKDYDGLKSLIANSELVFLRAQALVQLVRRRTMLISILVESFLIKGPSITLKASWTLSCCLRISNNVSIRLCPLSLRVRILFIKYDVLFITNSLSKVIINLKCILGRVAVNLQTFVWPVMFSVSWVIKLLYIGKHNPNILLFIAKLFLLTYFLKYGHVINQCYIQLQSQNEK